MLKISYGFSQAQFGSPRACAAAALSPIPSWDLKIFPQTASPAEQGHWHSGHQKGFVVSVQLCPELRLGPVVMQEGSCSAPQKGSASLAKGGHCFIFIFLTIENAAC